MRANEGELRERDDNQLARLFARKFYLTDGLGLQALFIHHTTADFTTVVLGCRTENNLVVAARHSLDVLQKITLETLTAGTVELLNGDNVGIQGLDHLAKGSRVLVGKGGCTCVALAVVAVVGHQPQCAGGFFILVGLRFGFGLEVGNVPRRAVAATASHHGQGTKGKGGEDERGMKKMSHCKYIYK